jgi:hypothetical protein
MSGNTDNDASPGDASQPQTPQRQPVEIDTRPRVGQGGGIDSVRHEARTDVEES